MPESHGTAALAPAADRHRLNGRHFDALAAGGGDEAAVDALLAAERSWRFVAFRAVLDELRRRPDALGPLQPPQEAWDLLARAHQKASAVVDRVLLHPQTGTWAGHVLRRLRGSLRGDSPIWIEAGYLHAIAAAAAILAQLDFTVRVPARDGFAILPTLGGAYLPLDNPWDWAEVKACSGIALITAGGKTVRATEPSSDGWAAFHTVRVEASGHTLSLYLDDLDPYRNLRAPAPARRLSTDEIGRWRTLLVQAWNLIAEVAPAAAPAIGKGLFTVVPQPPAERFRMMSASAGDAFGSATMSEPEDAVQMAVTLVHEFQHIKLGGLLHLVPLQDKEPDNHLYAPWRDDPRPLKGVLQGVYAFTGIVEFWRAFRKSAVGRAAELAHFEFALWRQQVCAVLPRLRELPELNAIGRRLIDGLTATASEWSTETVPTELNAAAAAAAADHHAMWRMHHMRPDPDTVARLASAWVAGQTPPVAYPDPTVEADTSARWLDTRAVLIRQRLTDPAGFSNLATGPTTPGRHVSGATTADLAYVGGDLERARELYLWELSARPNRVSAWSGLGLVLAASAPGRAAAMLQRWPELVLAVHRAAIALTDGPVCPITLANWVGDLPLLPSASPG